MTNRHELLPLKNKFKPIKKEPDYNAAHAAPRQQTRIIESNDQFGNKCRNRA
jgi:hypothetical protein